MHTTQACPPQQLIADPETGYRVVQPSGRPRRREQGSSLMWPLIGLAVLGLGAFAWYTFGPDLRRYMKIRHM